MELCKKADHILYYRSTGNTFVTTEKLWEYCKRDEQRHSAWNGFYEYEDFYWASNVVIGWVGWDMADGIM